MHRHASFIAAVLLALCVWACAATPKAVPTVPCPDAGRLLASLQQCKQELESFRGIGKLRITGKGDRQTARVAWIGAQPENLRVETLGVWGGPALTFLVNGSTFYLHSSQDNRYLKGRATARNLSRFVSIPVRAEVLFSLLSGQPPVLPFHSAKMQALGGDGQWLLCLYEKWGRLIEKMWLANDGATIERVGVFDGWGNLKYTVSFSRFEEVECLRIPHKIMVSHARGIVLSLDVEKFWTKVQIAERAFTLDLSGAQVVDVDS